MISLTLTPTVLPSPQPPQNTILPYTHTHTHTHTHFNPLQYGTNQALFCLQTLVHFSPNTPLQYFYFVVCQLFTSLQVSTQILSSLRKLPWYHQANYVSPAAVVSPQLRPSTRAVVLVFICKSSTPQMLNSFRYCVSWSYLQDVHSTHHTVDAQ